MRPARRHEVDGLHSAQGDNVFVAPRVTHHAHGFHGHEYGEGLADLFVPPCGAELFNKDCVRFP